MHVHFPFRPQNKLKIPATFPKFRKSDKGTIYKKPHETPYTVIPTKKSWFPAKKKPKDRRLWPIAIDVLGQLSHKAIGSSTGLAQYHSIPMSRKSVGRIDDDV